MYHEIYPSTIQWQASTAKQVKSGSQPEKEHVSGIRTHFSVAVPDEAPPDAFLLAGSLAGRAVAPSVAFPVRARALLVLGLPVEEPEALVAEASVRTEAGELDGELDDLGGLELRDVQRGVQHAELEAAVVAHVRAAPLRVDVERRGLFRNNH